LHAEGRGVARGERFRGSTREAVVHDESDVPVAAQRGNLAVGQASGKALQRPAVAKAGLEALLALEAIGPRRRTLD